MTEEVTKKEKSRFAFYGTLRQGQGNHRWSVAKDVGANFDGEHVIRGYKMYSLGGYPFVTPTYNEDDSIVVELYELTDPGIINSIHGMETGAGYRVEEITVDDKTYNMYVQPARSGYYAEVPNGDWVAYVTKRGRERLADYI